MRTVDKYWFMEQQNEHAKAKWATTLGVSKSGNYLGLKTREACDERPMKREQEVLEVYEQGNGHYGAERICGIIPENGGCVSSVVVKGIMENHHLKSSHCRRGRRKPKQLGYLSPIQFLNRWMDQNLPSVA